MWILDVNRTFMFDVFAAARPSIEHVIHNHTYHLPPDQTGAMQRPLARDKQKGTKQQNINKF